jgi:hypothetical protein
MWNVELPEAHLRFSILTAAIPHSTFNTPHSSNFPWVQEIEHRVGGTPGHKEDAIDNHREPPERPMAARTVRPDPLDRHLNREHNGDQS